MNYTKTVWKDLPDTSTPITASRLNNIEDGVEYLFENGTGGGDNLPVGVEMEFDGTSQDIPTGWEEINNSTTIIYKRTEANANLDNLTNTGIYGVFNATGTLPSGYSSNDNNFFIEVLFWYVDYGRQIAHDVRTNRTFIRNMNNGNWQSWKEFQIN